MGKTPQHNLDPVPRAALAKHRDRSSATAPASKSLAASKSSATSSMPDQQETQQMDLSPIARVFYGTGVPQVKSSTFNDADKELLRAKTGRLDSFANAGNAGNADPADAGAASAVPMAGEAEAANAVPGAGDAEAAGGVAGAGDAGGDLGDGDTKGAEDQELKPLALESVFDEEARPKKHIKEHILWFNYLSFTLLSKAFWGAGPSGKDQPNGPAEVEARVGPDCC